MPQWVGWVILIAIGHAAVFLYMLRAVTEDIVAAIDMQTKAIEALQDKLERQHYVIPDQLAGMNCYDRTPELDAP